MVSIFHPYSKNDLSWRFYFHQLKLCCFCWSKLHLQKCCYRQSFQFLIWSVLLTKNTWFIFWSGLGIITEINAFWCSWHAFVIWIQVDLIYICGWKAFIITLPPLLRFLLLSKHAGMIWCRLILLLQASTNFQWSISGDYLLTRALLLWTGKRRL